MTYKYTTTVDKNTMAKCVGADLSISTKQSVEVCNKIRGKTVEFAKKYLEAVIEMKQPVEMTRFNKDRGHKKGMGPGSYPIKACTEILALVKSAETNAQYKGLAGTLSILTIVPHRGKNEWHYGRQRRRKMKRTTVEIVVKEIEPAKKTEKKTTKTKPTAKVTPAPAEKKAEVKSTTQTPKVEKPKTKAKPVEKKVEAPVVKEETKTIKKPKVEQTPTPTKVEEKPAVEETKVESSDETKDKEKNESTPVKTSPEKPKVSQEAQK